MIASPTQRRWIGRASRLLAFVVLVYWAAFALLAPVTTWDSHVYNLGRLPLMERAGLWSNPLWTSERQLVFPLTFDAIHLPLLHLGFGFGLPSFLCLLGTMVIAWTTLERWHGPEAAWLGAVALLGLPTLVFQAVGTKNDVAVLFGLAVWWHAIVRWRDRAHWIHLTMAAVAIGFMAGAKTSGLPVALLSAVATCWLLRRNRARLAAFGLMLLSSFVLLGSIETYAMAYRTFGHPLGPKAFVHSHSNHDGLPGAAANAVRYVAGNLSTGLEPWLKPDRLTPWLEDRCRQLLLMTGLGDVGYRNDLDDAHFHIMRTGWDASSDFGPVGALGLGLMLLALCRWRFNDSWWRLALAAAGLLGLVAGTVAWMPWNNRFLLAPFALLAIGLVSFAWQSGRNWVRGLVFGVSAYAALAYPLTSFNKQPGDLVASVRQREAQEFKERSTLLPVLGAVRAWRLEHPAGGVFMIAGTDSWVLPFLMEKDLAIRPVPMAALERALDGNRAHHVPTAVLVMNRADFRPSGLPLLKTAGFDGEPDTGLYVLAGVDGDAGRTHLNRVEGFYADGWTAPVAVVTLERWPDRELQVELWNPTPLARQVSIETSADAGGLRLELAPMERSERRLIVSGSDTLVFRISPPFATGNPADPRPLGLRIAFPAVP